MKLRNKRTGEIVDLSIYGIMLHIRNTTQPRYYSISELNAEWEDYKPKEPLIKDEKIRKAVRAWAEAMEINDNKVAFDRYSNGFSCMENERLFSTITFDGRAFNFADGKLYSIAELCGEEE